MEFTEMGRRIKISYNFCMIDNCGSYRDRKRDIDKL